MKVATHHSKRRVNYVREDCTTERGSNQGAAERTCEGNVGLQYILDKHKKGKRDRVSYAKVELPHNNFTKGDHIPHEQEYNTRHGVSAIADEVCREIWR